MSAANENTATLLWRQDRLTVLIFIGGTVGLGAFLFTSFEYPAYSQWVLLAVGVGMVLGIAMYYVRQLIFAMSAIHATMDVVGFAIPYDIFYVKSNDPNESLNLEEDRWETEVPLVRPENFSEMYGDNNSNCFFIYLRHWDLWNNRVGRMRGIALAGGIPFVHSNSEHWTVKPLKVPPRQGIEGFKVYPTFELLWTGAGDASVDIEPFNVGWRSTLQKRREDTAMKVLTKVGLSVPKGRTASQYLKELGMKKNELQQAIADIEKRAKEERDSAAMSQGTA
jgi:hypothetical protein